MDREFDPLKKYLMALFAPVNLNPTSASKHVPDIKRQIFVTK